MDKNNKKDLVNLNQEEISCFLKVFGNQMKKVKYVLFAKTNSILLKENIIAENVDCKNTFIFHLFRVVCGTCSANSWYVPGYADKKVRMCDLCYKEWMTYKVSAHNINKTSVFSSYFGNNVPLH